MAEQKVPQTGPCVHDVGLIYGLASSEEPGAIRYVGFTTQRIKQRLKVHRREATFKTKWVSVWIGGLIEAGLSVVAVVLKEPATYADETLIIRRLREEGADLLNETDGGLGTRGRPVTERMLEVFRAPASEKLQATLREYNATRDYTHVLAGLRKFQADPENLRRAGRAISAAKAKHTPERKAEIQAKRLATIAKNKARKTT